MLKKFLSFDLYLFNILQFDFFDKKILFRNYIYFIFFQLTYLNFLKENNLQIFSKIYFIMRTFTFSLHYKLKKNFIVTKKNLKIHGFKFILLLKSVYDICVYLDFFRFIFGRFLFVYKQIIGISSVLKLNLNFLKNVKNFFLYFKIFFNDLSFRVNSLMDSLLNRENFIYFYENVDIFYNFILGFYNSIKLFKMFFTFLGFFIVSYKKFLKKYKFFVFYTIIM